MELINRKYRIIRSLDKKEEAYVAYDISSPDRLLQLTLIRPQNLSLELYSDLYRNFITNKSINFKQLQRDFELDRIKNIDGKRIEESLLFYTSEYFDNNCSFGQLLESCGEQERIEHFAHLCQTINSLQAIGKEYPKISLDNLLVIADKERYRIILRSLNSIELSGRGKKTISEFYERGSVYELGIMLLALFKQNISIFDCDFEKHSISQTSTEIIRMASRMTYQIGTKPYKDISEVIADINKLFDLAFKPYNVDELCVLHSLRPLPLHEAAAREVVEAHDENLIGKSKKKMFLVHGMHGTGKTYFLADTVSLMNIRGVDVYHSFELEDEEDSGNKRGIMKILKSIMEVAEKSLLKEYEHVLIKLLPELYLNKESNELKRIWEIHNEERLIQKTLEFVYKAVKGRPTAIVFDNIDYASEYSTGIINQIISSDLLEDNIIFILSYSDENNSRNESLTSLLNKIKYDNRIVDISLEGLNSRDSARLISALLPSGADISRINNKIYNATRGNPRFIKELIINFQLHELIKLDEVSGGWEISDAFDTIDVPDNIEHLIRNTLNQLESREIELLGIISVFNMPVAMHIIQSLYSQIGIESLLGALVDKGILRIYGYPDDKAYKITSGVYKNILYSMIEEPNRKIIHNIAAQLFEGLILKDRSSYFQELIYHLERAGLFSSAIAHCLKEAEIMDKYKNRSEAIKSLEMAISFYEPKSKSVDKAITMLRLGEKYIELCKYDKAMELYSEAKDIIKAFKNNALYVDALIGIIRIQIVHHEIKKALRNIKLAEEYLKKVDYLQGYLNISYRKAYVLFVKKDYEGLNRLVSSVLPMCGEANLSIKGDLYNVNGMLKSQLGLHDEALMDFMNAQECYESSGRIINQITTLINIGGCYAIHGDIENFGKYLLMSKKMNEAYGHDRTEVILDLNMSSYYTICGNYEACREMLYKVAPLAKKIGLMNFYVTANIFLINNNIRLFDFKEALYYYKLSEHELEKDANYGPLTEEYYFYSILLHFEIGSFKKQAHFASKITDGSNADININEIKEVYNILAHAIQKNELGQDALMRIIEILKSDRMHSYELQFFQARASMLLFDLGWKQEALQLLKDISCSRGSIHEKSIINSMKQYVFSSFENDARSLTELLEDMLQSGNRFMILKLCIRIAEMFYKDSQYLRAVIYYWDAFNELKHILDNLPAELKLQFMKLHGFVSPMENFFGILSSNKPKQAVKRKRINSIEAYEEIEKSFANFEVLHKKVLVEAAKDIFRTQNNMQLSSFEELVGGLQFDKKHNLNLVCRYLAVELACSRVAIAKPGSRQEGSIIADNKSNGVKELSNQIAEKTILELLIDRSGTVTVRNSQITKELNNDEECICYIIIESNHRINGISVEKILSLNSILKIIVLNIEKPIDYGEISSNKKYNQEIEDNKGIFETNLSSKKLDAALDMLELIKAPVESEAVTRKIMNTILELSKGQHIALLDIYGDRIAGDLIVSANLESKNNNIKYNKQIIDMVIREKLSFCSVDWDVVAGFDEITGVPYWNSVLVLPIIKSGIAVKVVYMTAPMDIREFDNSDIENIKAFVNII